MNNTIFLSPLQLAKRWQISKRTLMRMRERGEGPMPVKIPNGRFGNLRYTLADVEAYEVQQKMEAPQNDQTGEDNQQGQGNQKPCGNNQ